MSDPTDDHPSPEDHRPIILGGTETPAPEPAPPPAVEEVPPAPPPAAQPVRERRDAVMPILGVIGFLILAGAIIYLWVRPVPGPVAHMPAMPPDESGAVAALRSDVTTLRADVSTLQTQLASLDTREKSDVAALHAAIAAIRPPSTATGTPTPTATEQAPPTPAAAQPGEAQPGGAQPEAAQPEAAQQEAALQKQLADVSSRLDQVANTEAAQAKQLQALPSAGDVAKLSTRVDDLAQRQSQQNDALQQTLTQVQRELTTLSGQAKTLSQNAQALPQLTQKADRLSEILRAQAALRAGMPLGTLDGAPPALAHFAKTAPPTEADLRVSFPAAAKAAEAAGEPVSDHGPFWHRVWVRVQDLVTVRQGDRVIVGDPTGAILAHAQRLLDAGDLAGALTVLGQLSGPAATAMEPWEAKARSLLEAEQALAQMAAG